jgi:hypothetical protein
MRNNTNYMQTGVLTALQLASAFPHVILDNFYRKSRNSIESGTIDAPFAYVVPAGQPDMTRVEVLVNLLRTQGIEVGRITSEATLEQGTFPAGSYVVKRNQPYGRLAKILLEKQEFPDPNLRTYDDSGWTMGLHAHAEVKEINDKAVLDLPVEPVTRVRLAGKVAPSRGAASHYVVAHNGSNRMVTLRYRLKGFDVHAARAPFEAAGQSYPAGSLIVEARQGGRDAGAAVKAAVEELGLDGAALAAMPDVATHEVDLPRIALYSTWGSTQQVGWVRHALDHFEVAYDLIFKERVRAGALTDSYDVIVVPSQGQSAKGIVFDIEPKRLPLAYRKTDQFRFLGDYGESDDISGGMGLAGVVELQRFLEQGGLIVTMGTASFVPADFGLARSVDASRPSAQFYAPGPLVEAEIVQPSHPIFYGYRTTTIPVRYANGPLLQVPERDRERQVLMRFPGGDQSVLSGLMRGAQEIRNRPAVLDVSAGAGRLLIFATNPCYRWQNFGEFNMLFNALMHHNDLPPALPAAPRGTEAAR